MNQQHFSSPAIEEARNGELERRVDSYLRSREIRCLESIEIEVHRGTVVVRGRVPSAGVKHQVRECCRHVAGVFHVIDQLEVQAELS